MSFRNQTSDATIHRVMRVILGDAGVNSFITHQMTIYFLNNSSVDSWITFFYCCVCVECCLFVCVILFRVYMI